MAIAQEMELDEGEVRTIEIAANLLNLGKTLVPPEILTKTAALTAEEVEQVRDSILTSADLLQEVDFEGPVVDTIRQVQERLDGSGRPAGLSGEDILLSARILAVANAFVAMVSARAYRAGMSFDEVTGELTGQAGVTYDRRPVSALVNYVENRGGRETWAHFGVPPETPPETPPDTEGDT